MNVMNSHIIVSELALYAQFKYKCHMGMDYYAQQNNLH